MGSMGYNSRGRRAPAPAALDLGHRERFYSAEPESIQYSYNQRPDMVMVSPVSLSGRGAAVCEGRH